MHARSDGRVAALNDGTEHLREDAVRLLRALLVDEAAPERGVRLAEIARSSSATWRTACGFFASSGR